MQIHVITIPVLMEVPAHPMGVSSHVNVLQNTKGSYVMLLSILVTPSHVNMEEPAHQELD